MRTIRLIGVGALMHARHQMRAGSAMATAIAVPLVQATLAIYMFKTGNEEHRLLEASVGAGLMAVWTSVLSGSGGAIQSQRWRGTLEILMISPCSPTFTILPITLATSFIGACSMVATLLWGRLLFGIPFSFAHPGAFLVGVPAVILALGMFGFLLASTFVLLRNANVFVNSMEYPIWLLSGMLIPITVLPAWTRPVSAVLPTTWGARAINETITGGPVWPAMGICFAVSVAYLMIGSIALAYAERKARSTATLALA